MRLAKRALRSTKLPAIGELHRLLIRSKTSFGEARYFDTLTTTASTYTGVSTTAPRFALAF